MLGQIELIFQESNGFPFNIFLPSFTSALSSTIYILRSFMMQDIQEAHAGQIVAVFGVDCASGTHLAIHENIHQTSLK